MPPSDLFDHFVTRSAEYVIERYRNIPEGGNWEAVREQMSTYKNIENTHSNIYRRLSGSSPAITISHYRKCMLIHPSQKRGLSFQEACRLQSFPDWFWFSGTREQMQQQLLCWQNAWPKQLLIVGTLSARHKCFIMMFTISIQITYLWDLMFCG